MSKRITFNVPTEMGVRVEEGYVVWLRIGQTNRHKFVLQFDMNRPSTLSDYRSGYRLVNLAPRALARYVANPYAYREGVAQWRTLAQEQINELVADMGEEAFIKKLASVPTINE